MGCVRQMSVLLSASMLPSCARTFRSVSGFRTNSQRPCSVAQRQCFRSLHVDGPPHGPPLTCSYVHGTSTVPLSPLTVGQCLDAAVQRWPDREAVVFVQDGIRKTFSEFQADVDKAAAGLLGLGLKRGDRLGIWGPNMYDWILFQYASAKAGIIMVSLNPAYQENEVEFPLQKVQCKAILCPTSFKTQNFYGMLKTICPELTSASGGQIKSSRLPHLRLVILTDSRQPGTLHTDDVMQAGESRHHQELKELQSKLSCDDAINIQFTSGTTGKPKGVTLSHHNIVNNAYFYGIRMGFKWKLPVRACLPVPLYHAFGSVVGGICLAVHGITLVFPSSGYDSTANMKAIQEEKCNMIYGTPTMYTDLLRQQELCKYDLSSLEIGIMGGAPCPPEIVKRLTTQLNVKQALIGYGCTENSPVTFMGFPQDNEELKTSTVGCIMCHTEAKVVDPTTGEMVPLGSSGELLVRGSCVMHGYWDEPEKTREVISPDRWYRTGDTASLNSQGYCRIEGRIKDMIIRGGENIYPAEIEEFLYKHPKVQEVQVVGVKDERLGEQVCACIRLKGGQSSSTEEIRSFCKGQISHFKIPHYVMFVDSYPLTVTGKIKKSELKAEMEKKLGL